MADENIVGFLKYEGIIVEDGILDAQSASTALRGFHTAIQYFIAQDRPDLADEEIPIPVRIQKGSWEAIIPQNVEAWILATAGIFAAKYLATAATKAAEKDFKDVGLKDIFKKSLKYVQKLIMLGKHLGHLNFRGITGLKWDKDTDVGIPNADGVYFYLPAKDWQKLIQCPSSLLSEVSSVIEIERKLVIGVNEDGQISEVSVTRRERHIFYTDKDDKEILFPELKHGMMVDLEGIVTRGNEMANTIGFLYNDHILTCRPRTGNIVKFKKHLFLKCRIVGEITRMDKNEQPSEPRPKIICDDLIILDDKEQLDLKFENVDDEI